MRAEHVIHGLRLGDGDLLMQDGHQADGGHPRAGGQRDRGAEWPFDLDGHSSYHRVKDIEQALKPSSSDALVSKL